MPHHRLRRYFMARPASKKPLPVPTGFASIPVNSQAVAINGAPLADLYRMAYEAAKAQVEQRRAARRRAAEWN